jgi:hypothetical protein
MKLTGLFASSWLWLSGCTISAVSEAEDARPTNTCSSESDCESDENCNDGLCQPSNGQLEALLIEVTPPSDSEAPHLSFVSHLDKIPTSGGELKLPPVQAATVTGTLQLSQTDSCYPTLPQDGTVPLPTASDLSLPLSVTLIPRERLLGLPQQLYVTASDFRKDGTYKFDIVVPPGSYDIYMVPTRGQQGCVVPPQLFRGEAISGKTTLNYRASRNSDLINLQLHWPKGAQLLDGWTADVIEPLGGRPIATEVTLTRPSDRGTDLVYEIPLVYSTVRQVPDAPESVEFAGDLIRLRPPEGEPVPTIFLDRTGIGLLPGEPTITDFTRYPEPVKVEGQLARAADGAPLTGAVSVISTEIAGVDKGIIASFQATVEVTAESDGIFSLELPPGNYLVHAVPGAVVADDSAGNESLSSLETEWQIAAGVPFQAGKLLELKPSSVVTGQSFEGAEVRVSPSPKTVLPFKQAFGSSPFSPRGRSGLVESGSFAVTVDPGRFDISVRAPEAWGFGWFVKPGVEVVDATEDLGWVSMKAPSALRGTTTGLFAERDALVSKPVGSCAVRAYAYLDKDLAYTRADGSAVSVVQVAETRSDEQGAFRLLVPSSLAASK